ncbi:MAG: tetratricopeptide repeat protein [Myxococcota bacterium]
MARLLPLALASGVPALVYQVVWTRQLELLIGAQAPAVAVVVATFFAGLAGGAWFWGPRADRSGHPLRLFAGLEAGGALAALVAYQALGALADVPSLRLPLGALAILPSTWLLGGTLPALLCATSDAHAPARSAGALVAANTAGALGGVVAAALGAPTLGLGDTLRGAGSFALAVAAVAAAHPASRRVSTATAGPEVRPPLLLLAAAALAGATTLAFEVLATRAATLRLGSSLAAWSFVLASFLLGLAIGNAAAARGSARTRSPARTLGWIEVFAALALLAAGRWLGHAPTTAAVGLTAGSGLGVVLAILPAVVGMGAAFPFFVRLAAPERVAAGARFGALSAANTAGGIAGSLLAPFVLLPRLGLDHALLACALGGAALGLAFLSRGEGPRSARRFEVGLAAGALVAAVLLALPRERGPRPLFVGHDAQATVAVVREGGARHLYVDGDPEAASRGAARATEEWLALLPLALHPQAGRVLEVGLGSGITLGTVARFPLDRIACVEIAPAVPRAARFFAPENLGVVERARQDEAIGITIGDGRTFLLGEVGRWDLVLANTVQPASVGATGLYSREYDERLRRALAPGGLVAQWLPLELPEPAFRALLHTFFSVFPHGALWWGADNLIVIGAMEPVGEPGPDAFETLRARAPDALARLGLDGLPELRARRLVDAALVRAQVADGELLLDDRPRLELWSARQRGGAHPAGGLDVLERLAAEAVRLDPSRAPLADFVRSRAARRRGDVDVADALEARAEGAGLRLARETRRSREAAAAGALFRADRLAEAEARYRALLAEAGDHADARFGLAATRYRRGDVSGARAELEALVEATQSHAEAWNLLGALRAEASEPERARAAFHRALAADPWFREALANAFRLAERRGDAEAAAHYERRLRALD